MFICWPFYMYVVCSLKWHFKKWNCLIVQSRTAYQISYHYTRKSQNGNTHDSNTYMNFINTHLPGFTAPGIWLSPQCRVCGIPPANLLLLHCYWVNEHGDQNFADGEGVWRRVREAGWSCMAMVERWSLFNAGRWSRCMMRLDRWWNKSNSGRGRWRCVMRAGRCQCMIRLGRIKWSMTWVDRTWWCTTSGVGRWCFLTGIHREHLSSMMRLVRGNCLFWRGLLGDGGKLQFVGEGGVCQVQSFLQ